MKLKLVRLENKYKQQLFDMLDEWYSAGEKIVPYVIRKTDYHDNENGGSASKDILVLDKSYRQIAEGIISEVNSMNRSKGRSPIMGVN